MRLENGRIKDLMNRDDRAIARLANRATIDTIDGGARALVLAKRLEAMGSTLDPVSIVSDVYSASIGCALPKYRVCKCPECGSVYLGEDNALQCCALVDDQVDDDEPT